MASATPTKWGIASSGLICSDFVTALQCAKTKDNHTVVAVDARSIDRANKFADKFGIEKAYEGYKALAEDPNVDVVYVGVIHPLHVEVASLMINAGTVTLFQWNAQVLM